MLVVAVLGVAGVGSAAPGAPVTAPGAPVNAQLYNCGRPAAQTWAWDITGSGEIRKSRDLAGATAAGGALQLQSVSMDNPSLATTCPGGNRSTAPCWNLVVGQGPGLAFKGVPADPPGGGLMLLLLPGTPSPSSGLLLSAPSDGGRLCIASSTKRNGLIGNVFLTDCAIAGGWDWNATAGTFQDDGGGCLDLGSGGSSGDLGFEFALLPAAMPAKQALNSSNFTSWGGSVIRGAIPGGDGSGMTPGYHMFASVFADHLGLSGWTRHSEVMHLVSSSPSGPFRSAADGPNGDGIVVPMEAHNPTILRAKDG